MKGREQFVYFVRLASDEGPIKIGCSYTPARRLTDLMCWSPLPLKVLATLPGGFALESKIHRRFAATHSHKEWFQPTPELLSLIEAVSLGLFCESMVEVPKGTRSIHYSPAVVEVVQRRWRLRRLMKSGIAITPEVERAMRYATDPDVVAANREVIRAFVDQFPEAA